MSTASQLFACMHLMNKTLQLRAPEPEDLELLYEWENMTQFWDSGNTRQPYSRFALKQYISEYHKDIYETRQLRLMMTDATTGRTVGTVDLFDFDLHHSRIALGLFVAPEHKKKGYASAALQLTEAYVFEFLKVNQLYCQIAASNTASFSMFTNRNFSSVILKHWIRSTDDFEDVVLFQQFREQYLQLQTK